MKEAPGGHPAGQSFFKHLGHGGGGRAPAILVPELLC